MRVSWTLALSSALILVRSVTVAQDAGTPTVGVPTSIEDPRGNALSAFHSGLRQVAQAAHPVRVVVLGDSHTAGLVLPSVLKRTFAARFGDGGLGYFFPVRPWRYYEAEGVRTSRASEWSPLRIRMSDRIAQALGLGGVAVETSTSGAAAEIEFERAEDAQRVELWSYAQPTGTELEIAFDGRVVAHQNLQDSRPHLVVTEVRRESGASRMRFSTVRDGTARIFGVVAERAAHGVVVDALGINGARLTDQLWWEDSMFRESLVRRDPALVVLQYGTNESGDDIPLLRYEAGARRAVTRIRETVPNASCVLVGPTDRPQRIRRRQYVHRPRTDEIRSIQRRLASELGCGFFDTVAFQGGAMSTDRWALMDPPFASADRVHLTRSGYERWATVLADALLERD